ncbi:hypothetical protein [Blastochloris sulfoviridis]|uniref:Uncharacterized protein n=1 Tax=Blastochloris sulfoviridis TaxID=50712 RepID=A0A5M6HXW1_9HYPH|nr:hypothetical protein [Blastochloris sulfoviridis]KAA5600458.1 hypothetical protein F1193_10500 [Blastochloris sulfoviridis]
MNLFLTIAAYIIAGGVAFADGFLVFPQETKSLSGAVKCNGKVTRTDGMPDLWGCIAPGAEVVKLFVNEAKPGRVDNVKLMWNDWTKDIGYGVHTDRAIAETWAVVVAKRYAPSQVTEVLDAFRGERNTLIESSSFRISYKYSKGPAIDERLLIVTEKQ